MSAPKIKIAAPVYLAESFPEHAATILTRHLQALAQVLETALEESSHTVKVAFAISSAETIYEDDVLDADLEANGINPEHFDTLPVQKLIVTGTIQTAAGAYQETRDRLEHYLGALDELVDVTLQDVARGKAAGFRIDLPHELIPIKSSPMSAPGGKTSAEAAHL